jgi:hypothetical protein
VVNGKSGNDTVLIVPIDFGTCHMAASTKTDGLEHGLISTVCFLGLKTSDKL